MRSGTPQAIYDRAHLEGRSVLPQSTHTSFSEAPAITVLLLLVLVLVLVVVLL